MESFEQTIGALYSALVEAGGPKVKRVANAALVKAVTEGAVSDAYSQVVLLSLVRNSRDREAV